VCPNLKVDVLDNLLLEEFLDQVVFVSRGHPVALEIVEAQSKLEKINRIVPEMNSLLCSALGAPVIDFSILRALTVLRINCCTSNLASITSLPLSLRQFRWRESEDGELDSTALDAFCLTLTRHCPLLLELRMKSKRNRLLSKENALQLLGELAELEIFIVQIPASEWIGKETFPVSHRRLSKLDFIMTSDGFKPILISSLQLHTLMSATFKACADTIHRCSFPALKSIFSEECGASSACNFLNRLHRPRNLKDLELMYTPQDPEITLDTLSNLKGVTVLRITPGAFSESILSALFGSLPVLTTIACNIRSSFTDWTWFKHPRLAHVTLSGTNELATLAGIGESDTLLRVDSTNVPFLTTLTLELREQMLHKLEFKGLKQLSRLQMVGRSPQRYSITVHDCPYLWSLFTLDMEFDHYNLRGLPSMSRLATNYGSALLDLDLTELGVLRHLEIHYSNSEENLNHAKIDAVFRSQQPPDFPLVLVFIGPY
jgi:hypothetical protein